MHKTNKKKRWPSIPSCASKEMTKLLNYSAFQPANRYQNKCITILLGKDMNGFCEAN